MFQKNDPTYFIAEIGSNHDGSLEEAIRYVCAAKEAGADAVKFQSFSAKGLFSRKRPAGGDMKNGWETHPAYEVIERLTVPDEWHFKLRKECDAAGIHFISAPFDIEKARLLREVGVPAIKIASGELTHHALLSEVATYGIPVILSTGMATLGEVEAALGVLRSGGCAEVVVLHCVSNYPPKFSEMNVRAVKTMSEALQVPVGISDHTPGWTVPMLALAMGSRCIEKHVTFDRARKGPDHPYAMLWEEFAAMVREIRNGEAALGDGLKRPTADETPERVYARKGVYAAQDLRAGDVLTPSNTKLVRHAFGIGAEDADKIYGARLARARAADEAVTWEDFKP